jgi:CheY-like chemotaxis protein
MSDSTFDFKNLFDHLPVAVIVSNTDQFVQFSNHAAKKLFGSLASESAVVLLKDLIPVETTVQSDWKNSIDSSFKAAVLSMHTNEAVISPTFNQSKKDESSEDHIGQWGGHDVRWHVSHTPLSNPQQNLSGVATLIMVVPEIQNGESASIQTGAKRSHPSADILPSSDGRLSEAAKTVAALSENVSGVPAEKGHTNLSILLVEDNEDLRGSTSELLQFLGHRVVSVPDAEQALRQLNLDSFDVLFTDLTLPKMTGAELARQVLQHHHRTSVIITSGYGRAMANAQNLDAVFIPKPYRFSDLEEVLKNLVRC